MPELRFRQDWIQFLFEHRTLPADVLFQAFNALGDLEGYVLVITLIHVSYDKRLAFRLALLAPLTMLLNHGLKTVIANPRPFVLDGTYAEKWAVPDAHAQTLVAEFSTPSGHAMTGASFYGYLWARTTGISFRVVAFVCILLTGLARPYIGVHYVEDVLMGWLFGLGALWVALRIEPRIVRAWNQRSRLVQGAIPLAASALIWGLTLSFYDSTAHGPPIAVLNYLGLITGLVIAYPLEEKWVNFAPRSSGRWTRALRWVLSISLVGGTLALLDWGFALAVEEASRVGHGLRYLRYTLAAAAGLLAAPCLFIRLGLAGTEPISFEKRARSHPRSGPQRR